VGFYKMKWLVVIARYLPEKVGGTFTYVEQFTKALIERGDTVHIVTTTKRKDLPSIEVKDALTIHRIYVEKGNMGPIYFNYTKKVTDYINQLDQTEHFDCINPHGAFTVNTSKTRKDLTILYTLHAVVTYEYMFSLKKLLQKKLFSLQTFKALAIASFKLPLSFFREWLAVKDAHKIIVMSNYVKGTIATFLPGIGLDRVHVSRIGIDESFIASENKEQLKVEMNIKNDITFLTVRRLESRMGLDNLITALSILHTNNKLNGVKLYIAGKGSLKGYFEQLINGHNLGRHIQLLGFVTDEDLRKWYQVSDAFIMPTEQLEGFGIVTIEAFASNLPVIATPAGANPEVAGLLCPELLSKSATSPDDIANAISIFLDNSITYQNINYSERAKKIFNWPVIVEEVAEHISRDS
tara:strand:- start:14079 stop:15305 length:1227 start_codon:yes stop_codon:yes gene_type:complete